MFDTGPLSHMEMVGRLDVFRAAIGDSRALIPEGVQAELRRGVEAQPVLQEVLDATWLTVRRLDTDDELVSYASFAERLVEDGRNQGEAEVLALAATLPGIAVVDDGDARTVAQKARVQLKPTLALLFDAIRADIISEQELDEIADDLIASKYRLPFSAGEAIAWGRTRGML